MNSSEIHNENNDIFITYLAFQDLQDFTVKDICVYTKHTHFISGTKCTWCHQILSSVVNFIVLRSTKPTYYR